jgi:hypothetical protein
MRLALLFFIMLIFYYGTRMDLRFISTSPLNVKLILYNDNKLLNSTDAGKTIFLDGLTKCIMHFVSVLTSVLATDDCSLQ